MKEFYYDNIEDYLEMADKHGNPKTIKMFEMVSSMTAGKKLIRAVTYLRTNLIGFQKDVIRDELDDIAAQLTTHDHKLGVILEGGKLL